MEPIRYENNIAVFTSEQINIYGEPDEKFKNYYVVDGQPDYMVSFAYHNQSQMKLIHRYDRTARFKKTLYNLLGECNLNESVKIATMTQMLGLVKTYVKDDTSNSYEDTRKILIHYGFKEWIPHIPAILKMTGKPPALIVDQKNLSNIIQNVLEDFKMVERRFFREDGYKGKRSYCLNLRYLALKLLVDRGVQNVCIPLLRTKRKLVDIEQVYNKLLKK